ncbi:MAG: molybdopterin-dependent oxidoreductase [Actinomycetota bacterium]|nr:molybdopterin-dependent oxidoreductase [Actinomycetota bacterium]
MTNTGTIVADTSTDPTDADVAAYAPTACILCECNCGIEVRLGGDGRTFDRIRGDKAHPASKGYTCEKALRLNHYQNGGERLTSPMRRREDGTYEAIDWDTAVREVAEAFARVRDTYGGESIFFYGGGGQGNHLLGAYAAATFRGFGGRYRSSALAQEKTGEFWVNGEMFGRGVRGDFEHCEVALFVGKNPWQSHGMPHARTTLKEIARDPQRAMIVIDPRRTETAEMADFHLAVRPGTDAWCLAALAATIVQEGLTAGEWVRDHVAGTDEVCAVLRTIDVDAFARVCDLDPQLVRGAARRIAAADSVAVFEDLGVQMGLNSTLCSWLEKLVWVLTGNFGKPGAQFIPTAMVPLVAAGKVYTGKTSPVAGARIISGLVPCNVVSEEILTDHPRRYRAMLVDSGNPAHSLADSNRMREALRALDLLVVIDVAMTETAQEAHYVLPAASQYEKFECTFFNFEFPGNVFHLRRPLLDPLPGTLPEPEIHARIVEAAGLLNPDDMARLRGLAGESRLAFGAAFLEYMGAHPELGAVAPVILYRTLGPTLPHGAAAAAVLWNAAHRCAMTYPDSVRAAGIEGEGLELGEALFDAILSSPSGITFSVDDHEVSWTRLGTDDGRIHLVVAEMMDELTRLSPDGPPHDPSFPLVLSAGERRSFTANTIFRDRTWRKKDEHGALRVAPADAAALGLVDGGRARVTTASGSVEVMVEVAEAMRAGHVSLPNGFGIDGAGVSPNELTSYLHRDEFAGTPLHKHVPARVEAVT